MCVVCFLLTKISENDWVLLFALFVVVYFGRLISNSLSFLSTHSNSGKETKKNKTKQNKTKARMQNVYFGKFEEVILIPLTVQI